VLYRPYTSQDFAQLYAIEEVCFEPADRFGRGYMQRLVNSSNTATWVAENDGQMAGFAIVEWRERKKRITAYIQTIEVSPESRGQGVGRELLAHIEDSSRAASAALIWLHVDAANTAAIRLYERHGYCCEGREENFYPGGRPALIYLKRLG
jgi:[ribosomal protein S18]-alanine N-acetyltransferase